MNNYLIRKKFVLNSITILTFIIFVFFISHIFFGERSVWKIFSLNSLIAAANKDYNKLNIVENFISLLFISFNSLKKYGGKNFF